MKLLPGMKELDAWFSKYIRLRDADRAGYVRCCTCRKIISWKGARGVGAECGHFITRDRWSVRYDERNAHAQCNHCNNWSKGEQYEHSLYIDRVHGSGTAALLRLKSRMPSGLDRVVVQELTKLYRGKVKAMMQKLDH